jgi:leucyl-tRNA---protein transferase
MPCPYLENRNEQQLFTELSGSTAQEQFETLSRGGFRRSHQVIYRPACRACDACTPVRISTHNFEMTRAWRRITNKNADLIVEDTGKNATDEQYALFQRYVTARHSDGEMANMSRRDYSSMVLTSPVDTSIIEFRTSDGTLVAGCLIDHLSDGYSAVYSFFEPNSGRQSLGSYIVLWLVQQARLHNLEHIYLGYLVEGSSKMAYKARFGPLEAFGANGWVAL